MGKLTTQEFIKKSKEIHRDKYDYSKVNYTGAYGKINIICPKHGEFIQTAHNHLNGNGCLNCAKESNIKKQTSNTVEFIKKAKIKHGDKYDYSKVNYTKAINKITIICPKHGEFEQRAIDHLTGRGCPECGGHIQSNTEKFIKKAKQVHKDKYDYSKVNYLNNQTKVIIICPEHGEFEQTPNSHLRGSGCPLCVGRSRNTIDYIKKAKDKHGDKYNYSKTEYQGTNKKVVIICSKHGEFEQVARNHLRGSGCPLCNKEKNIKNNLESYRLSFIKKAKEVHGDKYDYSKVNYINSQTKVTIICPEHGEFKQIPGNHLGSCGCPKCSGRLVRNTEDFIKRAKEVHGDKYDYSKVNYINSQTKVTIICAEHGEFEQKPNTHLRGNGCLKCSGRLVKNTEEFILRAKEVHGDKYDYSKVNYINSQTKVTIICPEHGEFEQRPNSHLSGTGCPFCSGGIKYTKENFIKRAKEVHGDKYDYSKVNYTNSQTKVTIICTEHGEFEQRPSSHLRGSGCPECSRNIQSDTEDFIKRAKEVHGDKYDYSKVNYINNQTKVTIICTEHGEFEQRPSSHLRGNGCPKCVGKNKTTNEWITEAKEIHGNKYDYSKIDYQYGHKKVTIICPEHGEFEQTPSNHLQGQGCPICSQLLSNENSKYTTEDFISKAKKIHGDRYDYSKVVYNGIYDKVCIICSKHGEFQQTPTKHLCGCGCQKCNYSHLEREVELMLISIGLIESDLDFDNRINIFKSQYKFPWLKHYKEMPLDFYIPSLQISIECQGDGHFKPIKRSRNQKDEYILKIFSSIQKRDKIKKELCEKHGIEIIYFLEDKYVSELKNGEKYFTTIESLKDYIINKMISKGISIINNRHYLTNRIFMESLF